MRRRLALPVFVLALATGCEPDHERNWLYRGEWIAVDGWGREADEACPGTFEYLDAYSGMLAAEFGLDRPLGVFRWVSLAHFFAGDLPCKPGSACVKSGEAYSPSFPDDHEVVHLANRAIVRCPSVLSEGLAVYYGGTWGSGSASGDLELLSARLKQPDASVPFKEYAIAGRFASFLVHEFGLAKVLEVCKTTGRDPDAATLSWAMQMHLGKSADELVEQLAAEPEGCNAFNRYQAKLYACGEDPQAPRAGVVEARPGPDFVKTYAFGCGDPEGVGSVDGEVEFVQQIEIAEADVYRIHVTDLDDPGSAPPVEMVLAACGYCGEAVEFEADIPRTFQLEGGRYWLELRAPWDYAGRVELKIGHHPSEP
jgi:hypothetical protein